MAWELDCVTRMPDGVAGFDALAARLPEFIEHARQQVGRVPHFHITEIVHQKLVVAVDGGVPRVLDPQDDWSFACQWRMLRMLMKACGIQMFDGLDPVVPWPPIVEERFDYRCRIDGPTLRVERTMLTSNDPALQAQFSTITKQRMRLAVVPRSVLDGVLRDLDGHLVQDAIETPILPFVVRARELLERLTVMNHALFAALIDGILARHSVMHPYEILTSHLAPDFITSIDPSALRERIRRDHPGFEFPRVLEDHHMCCNRPDLAPPRVRSPLPVPAPPEPVTAPTDSRFTSLPYPEELSGLVTYLRSSLQFHRWRINDKTWEDEEVAVHLLEHAPELEGEWDSPPEIHSYDATAFWRKEYEEKSATGAKFSQSDCLRYALYSAPYQSVSKAARDRVERQIFDLVFGEGAAPADYRLYAANPKTNSWFINEWWDFCWVLFHRTQPEVIAITGTATD